MPCTCLVNVILSILAQVGKLGFEQYRLCIYVSCVFSFSPAQAEIATTRTCFHQAPRVLGIQLGRFRYDKDTKTTPKQSHYVSYPHWLDFTRYMNTATKPVVSV